MVKKQFEQRLGWEENKQKEKEKETLLKLFRDEHICCKCKIRTRCYFKRHMLRTEKKLLEIKINDNKSGKLRKNTRR